MDCDKINVSIVEEEIKATFSEDAVSVSIVEETINVRPVEETIAAQVVEETLSFKIESAAIEYTGTKVSQIEHDIEAGENINALKVLRNDLDNKAYIADSSDVNETNRILGVAKIAALAGNSVQYVISGILEDASFNFDVTSPVFFDSNGALTQTPPPSGFVTIIGMPETNKILNVNIRQGIDLI